METYIKLLKTHDWYFNYSDDHRVWKAGQAVWEQIRTLQPKCDPDYSIWNEHCPKDFLMAKPVRQQLAADIDDSKPKEITLEELAEQYPGCNQKMLQALKKVIDHDRQI